MFSDKSIEFQNQWNIVSDLQMFMALIAIAEYSCWEHVS